MSNPSGRLSGGEAVRVGEIAQHGVTDVPPRSPLEKIQRGRDLLTSRSVQPLRETGRRPEWPEYSAQKAKAPAPKSGRRPLIAGPLAQVPV